MCKTHLETNSKVLKSAVYYSNATDWKDRVILICLQEKWDLTGIQL